MRAFVAIAVSADVRAALSAAPARALPSGVRVKWVAAQNLHVTLEFLGEVDDAARIRVTRALSAASSRSRAFEIAVRGLGQFPERGSPRVVWAGADGGTALFELARAVRTELVSERFTVEARPFHPHVTLGRVEGASREEWWPRDPSVEFGKFEVKEFALVESRLSPAGPAYRDIERFPLLAP